MVSSDILQSLSSGTQCLRDMSMKLLDLWRLARRSASIQALCAVLSLSSITVVSVAQSPERGQCTRNKASQDPKVASTELARRLCSADALEAIFASQNLRDDSFPILYVDFDVPVRKAVIGNAAYEFWRVAHPGSSLAIGTLVISGARIETGKGQQKNFPACLKNDGRRYLSEVYKLQSLSREEVARHRLYDGAWSVANADTYMPVFFRFMNNRLATIDIQCTP
jgi:hypothetical protein